MLLSGLRVLVTRPARSKADRWAAALSAAGATVVSYPTIDVLPPPSWEPLDQALRQVGSYDWIVFTSQTAVQFTASRMDGGRFPAGRARPRVAAVGTETARALERAGAHVDLVASDQRQEGLMEAFRDLEAGTRLLFPHAFAGRDTLIEALRGHGCQVDLVAAYQTAPLSPLPPPPAFDVATFASPSALRAFVERHGTRVFAGKTVAVIGPTTAAEAASHGLSPAIAAKPNIDALISAIASARSPRGGH
ncbi:MAG TPA: uroporphyrinogen-III synthase [Polyangia bacterium]|jgi:Uroporphyrinogen-III synthase|nr:uroporphyrinogen-III synthase [Polyangia bacterium]